MSALRVAVLHQREGGGSTTAVLELTSGLRARGHTVEDLTPAAGEGLPHVLRALGEFAPDVVHAHCIYNALPYEALSEIAASHPLAWTLHDVLPVNQFGVECWECFRNAKCLGCPALPWWKRWRPNHRTLARAARRRVHEQLRATLVLPSHWMEGRIARTELAALPHEVIPYGIALGPWAELAAKPQQPARVLFAGNMYAATDHRKGLPDLLAAWPRVLALMPAAELRVAGRVAEGLLPAFVSHAGELSREALRDELAAAAVVCVPSRGDNLPLAVIEAMATRRCVVAARTGGIPELVEDGVSGLLFPVGAAQELAHALVRALSERAFAEGLGVEAQRRARVMSSIEVSAARHEALYLRLAFGA